MTKEQIKEIHHRAQQKKGRLALGKIPFSPFPSAIRAGYKKLLTGRNSLRSEYRKHLNEKKEDNKEEEHREFSLDGRLVGDIGEVIASLIAPITLTEGAGSDYDGYLTSNKNKKVQIRCTFRDGGLAIKHGDGHFLAIQLSEKPNLTGEFRVIYDGPAKIPWIYANANKKEGKRNKEKEDNDRGIFKVISLGTWALLNKHATTKFIQAVNTTS